ncbi:MAG TPA: hypothetical protein VHP34_07995 [Alphaproteobacteria bacterium]|nr:hypothetical protein [Alphaproteobacteria bacterium]
MRAVFHSAAFKETTDAFAKAVAIVAAGGADEKVIEAFWQDDKKPEELRAALLRAAFKAACRDGQQSAAVYMLAHYPAHLNIAEIKKSALAAVAAGHDALALHLTEKMIAADERKDAVRATEIICAEAFEKGSASLVKNLLTLLPQTDSTQLYRAALGNKPENLDLILSHCKTAGTVAQEDLDQALVISFKNKNMPMTQTLLASGADADGCRKAPLKRVAEWEDTEAATTKNFLSVLLDAGADPLLAQEIFPPVWRGLIQETAAKTQQRHFENIQSVAGGALTMDVLRDVKMLQGNMTGLHYAAKHRLLDRLSLSGLSAADLDAPNAAGQTLTQIIEQSGAWQALLQPSKWLGQKDVLQHFVAGLSEKAREKINLHGLLHEVDIRTLRTRAHGLSLKPKRF